MLVFDIKAEPIGKTYRDLLGCGARFCQTFILVVREEKDLNAAGEKLLADLSRFLISSRLETSWPGTELLGRTALVLRYTLDPSVIDMLVDTVPGLFGWTTPSRPEDLCLLRPDNVAWLTTIAHERDAYLSLMEGEDLIVRREVPGLHMERSQNYQ